MIVLVARARGDGNEHEHETLKDHIEVTRTRLRRLLTSKSEMLG
jgi:hypothetical protein